MIRAWTVLVSTSVLAATVGCSDGGDDSGPDDEEAKTLGRPETPDTIDIDVCSEFGVMQGGECSECCHAAGFENAAFSWEDSCVCGPTYSGTLPYVDEAICATQLDTCEICCNDAGYKLGSGVTDCRCIGPVDKDVCATRTGGDASVTCRHCCLEAGFITGTTDTPTSTEPVCWCG